MSEQLPPETSVWGRAVPTLRQKPVVTREISHIFTERIAPVIQKKCMAWAKNKPEYDACRRYVVRRIVDNFFSLTRRDIAYLEGQAGVTISWETLPRPVEDEEVKKASNDYIKECDNAKTDRAKLACLIERYTNASRVFIIGAFYGSAVAKDSPYYMKPKVERKKPEKIPIEASEVKMFDAAIKAGNGIRELCKGFADEEVRLDNEDARKPAYFYCRVATVFRSLPYSLPRRRELQIAELAKKEGLSNVYKEVVQETQEDIKTAQSMYKEELVDRLTNLKGIGATKTPIPYIAVRIARRAVTSTIGNAIAKKAPYPLQPSGT